MKLWKGATFAFMLCSATLSIILTRNMATIGQFRPRTKYHAFQSSPRPSSSAMQAHSSSILSSSQGTLSGLHRKARSTQHEGSVNSVFSEFSKLFQSFTEGELQQVVGTLLDRKRRKDQRRDAGQARRSKRARRPKPCSLREVELTVSELGLGYESDETLLFRYCSGRCAGHRRNYDIALEHVRRAGFGRTGRKEKVSNGPCCRPLAYEEDMSFLDNHSRYHTIQEVSAQACGCV